MMNRMFCCAVLWLFAAAAVAQPRIESYDTSAVAKIRDEGLNRSQVMDILSYLTDVHGPRLTGSPEYTRAAAWTEGKLAGMGLTNIRRDKFWFGRGWTAKKFSAYVIAPRIIPLNVFPKAWSPATSGSVKGDFVLFNPKTEADLAQYKGRLKKAIVLWGDGSPVTPPFAPLATRTPDSVLLQLANAAPGGGGRGGRRRGVPSDTGEFARYRRQALFEQAKLQMCIDEGAAAIFEPSSNDAGTIRVMSASVPYPENAAPGRRIAPYMDDAPETVPQFAVAVEHYNRLLRMMERGEKLRGEVQLDCEFSKPDSAFSIIAELPGTDLKDEYVVVGGHFDSWHGGTGATDDASGVAAAMEAVRILKAAGLQPRRTIIVGLWAGEEEGLLGSGAFVAHMFGEREGGPGAGFRAPAGPLKTKPAYEKFSAYYNLDNGAGKIRGIYTQGNEALRPIFRAWLQPFADLGASTISARNTGSTDHVSFDNIGLPGFQFIQDGIDYGRTWHTNQDLWDRVSADDLKQAATIIASFVYHTAQRDAKLPRKPLQQ